MIFTGELCEKTLGYKLTPVLSGHARSDCSQNSGVTISFCQRRGGASLAGSAPYLVAVLEFDSMLDIQTALASVEGQAAAADLPNFALGGATLLMYDNKPA